METCSLYNRLGKLIRKRSEIEQALKSIGDSKDKMRVEDKMRLNKQLGDIVTDIENVNRELDAKEIR